MKGNYKMKKLFSLLIALGTLLMCFSFTGCNATVDTAQTLSVKFKGVNGYGTATLEDEYDWIDEVNKSDNELELLANEIKMREAVQYSLDKADHLSNGDVVTVTITTKEVKDLKMNFKDGEVKFTVEGLKEADTFDPFEDVNISFEGYAPNGTLNITGGDGTLTFTADKTNGLKNGDTVTITVKPSVGDIERYIETYNKVYSPESKEFTVDGLAAYVTKLDEIPSDVLNKMKTHAEDSIKATAANKYTADGCVFKSADFLGYYFLNAKDGTSTNPRNAIYCVYKCTQTLKGAAPGPNNTVLQDQVHDDVYYTWYAFTNAMILPDGTCSVDLSSGSLTSSQMNATIGYRTFIGYNYYVLYGYKDIDAMVNDTITKNVDKYTYENTVKDTEPSAPAEENSSENSSDNSSEVSDSTPAAS